MTRGVAPATIQVARVLHEKKTPAVIATTRDLKSSPEIRADIRGACGAPPRRRAASLLATAALPLLLASPGALPTLSNLRLRSQAERDEFRGLLNAGILIPLPTDTTASLEAFFIPKSDGRARLIVNGAEAATRGHLSPRLPMTESVRDSLTTAMKGVYRAALDLKGAYYQVRPREPPSALSIRVEGRIYGFTGVPQGLASAPAVCCQVFQRLFQNVGMSASYMDNAVLTGDDKASVNERLDASIQLITDAGFSLSPHQTVRAARTIPFLGLQVSKNVLELPAEKAEKLKTVIQEGTKKQLDGYRAYLMDIFRTDAGIRFKRTFAPHRIYCDGAKGKYAAAIAICDDCEGAARILQKKVPQASQVISELEGLLLASRLQHLYPDAPTYTDAKYCTEITRPSKAMTMVRAVMSTMTRSRLRWVRSDENTADRWTRAPKGEVQAPMCTC